VRADFFWLKALAIRRILLPDRSKDSQKNEKATGKAAQVMSILTYLVASKEKAHSVKQFCGNRLS
jgi:hypothetical protein